MFSKHGAADLTGSLRLMPNQLAFAAGDPVTIDVTITNNGNVRAAPFWVDLYINPSQPPSRANRSWNMVCGMTPCFGITWAVPGGLGPGESITLQLRARAFRRTLQHLAGLLRARHNRPIRVCR